MEDNESDLDQYSISDIRENSGKNGNKKTKENYLLQEPQDGVILQVRDILLQLNLLLSLISHPVQHLGRQ